MENTTEVMGDAIDDAMAADEEEESEELARRCWTSWGWGWTPRSGRAARSRQVRPSLAGAGRRRPCSSRRARRAREGARA